MDSDSQWETITGRGNEQRTLRHCFVFFHFQNLEILRHITQKRPRRHCSRAKKLCSRVHLYRKKRPRKSPPPTKQKKTTSFLNNRFYRERFQQSTSLVACYNSYRTAEQMKSGDLQYATRDYYHLTNTYTAVLHLAWFNLYQTVIFEFTRPSYYCQVNCNYNCYDGNKFCFKL